MGISSNQARFLTLTSRQIDLEYRVQQICQRRLRLASELERVASEYNNKISNRSMYTFNTTNAGISGLSVAGIQSIKDANGNYFKLVAKNKANGYSFINIDGQNIIAEAYTTSTNPSYKTQANVVSNMSSYTYDDTNAIFTYDTSTDIMTVKKDASTYFTLSATDLGLTSSATAENMMNKMFELGYLTVNNTTGELSIYNTANIIPINAQNDLGLHDNATEAEILEAAIRAGVVSIATVEDIYTQQSYDIGGTDYEIRDWRTLSQLADELYKGDNAEAETTYEKVTAEINAQDKKLQLEQTAIEVEYKAVTTEKDAVKKILDQNAQASFKYFS